MKSTILSFLLTFTILFSSCSNDNSMIGDDNEIPAVIDSSKPNILLIIADDMGLDATPGYNIGSTKPFMPNLQKMISTGIRFNNLWSYPTCTPTRSSIITGKYGFRTNVIKVDDPLSTTEISLQKHLDNNNSGYSHAVIGKWHLSRTISHPIDIGVGYYAGMLSGGVQSYTSWSFVENGQTSTSNEYTTSKLTDLAIDWIDNQDKPWFLWLAYNAPHTPFHLPPNDLHTQSLASDQASIDADPFTYYIAALEAMDTEMGRLLTSMTQEQKDNTMIIFIGDNGTPNKVVQTYARQRAKGSLYQGGVNVPMIVSGKNISRFNESDDSLINTTDLFATIADIAGTGTKQVNDSRSFKESFDTTISQFRDYIYTEKEGDEYTIRNKTHKYIRFTDGSESFYNLSLNPLEDIDLLDGSQGGLSSEDDAIKNELITAIINIKK
ncbi:sulfatase-like hydrolase/transferase [Tenacibaculum sp.]|nr:sulfatase-like hydrolase/transferase [Tenacibaculum sp.]